MAIVSNADVQKPIWQPVLLFTLLFWLSGSCLLDFVMMPIMYTSGMMIEPGFASAGYSMFWVFNRVELICAALALTGVLSLYTTHKISSQAGQLGIVLATLLLGVALVYTYGLTPQMSALGLNLNLFAPGFETPAGMTSLHAGYWLLEAAKLTLAGFLLKLCYRSMA